MRTRTHLARWSLVVVPTLALLAACSDGATKLSSPSDPGALRTSLTPASGIPTGKTVVVFKDTSSIPLAGITLLNSLGGTITKRWDNIGVAFVSVLLFIGAAIVGLMLGFLVTSMLSRTFPVAFPPDPFESLLSQALLVACTLGAGVSAAVIYARSHLRNRPGRRLGPEHFGSAPAVSVEDFSAQGITLGLYNPKYAALMSRANPRSGSDV